MKIIGTKVEPYKLVIDLKKIVPHTIGGIYSRLTVTDKSNEYSTSDIDKIFLDLYIVGKTVREYYDPLTGIEPWYGDLETESIDYAELKQLNYGEFDKLLESLLTKESGLLSYQLTNEPSILFSDFHGAFIHNVILIKLNFGNNKNSSSVVKLYTKIISQNNPSDK